MSCRFLALPFSASDFQDATKQVGKQYDFEEKNKRNHTEEGILDNITKHLNKLNNIWVEMILRARTLVST